DGAAGLEYQGRPLRQGGGIVVADESGDRTTVLFEPRGGFRIEGGGRQTIGHQPHVQHRKRLDRRYSEAPSEIEIAHADAQALLQHPSEVQQLANCLLVGGDVLQSGAEMNVQATRRQFGDRLHALEGRPGRAFTDTESELGRPAYRRDQAYRDLLATVEPPSLSRNDVDFPETVDIDQLDVLFHRDAKALG